MGVNVEWVFTGTEVFNRRDVVSYACVSVVGLSVAGYAEGVGSHSVSEVALPCFTTAF